MQQHATNKRLIWPSANPKKVLITGANGFIGNKLMAHYQAQGIPVVGVDLSGNGEDIFQGDIGQPETISQLLQDC